MADGPGKIPECTAHGKVFQSNNNQQVLYWKASTPNQFLERALVEGPVTRAFPDQNGHQHFEISIGQGKGDVIEVIFNEEFGPLPKDIQPGQRVIACGDYITSNAPTSQYPASPSDAIVHWVHLNPDYAPNKPKEHESGFVVLDGHVYGDTLKSAHGHSH